MDRAPAALELHYAIWSVLSIPFGFIGLVYLLPGLQPVPGAVFLALSGAVVVYVTGLVRRSRTAWLLGTAAHAVLLLAAAYYLPRWPTLLAWPLALANLYSLGVLLLYRDRWSKGPTPAVA